ncbi:MAG: hypothetical protein ABEJ72_05690 [Candidatus Aenigmatarchaeota archaeon]
MEGKWKELGFMTFQVFLFALIIEAFNFVVLDWWYFVALPKMTAFLNTLLLWIVLGMIIGFLRVFERERLMGIVFAAWGVTIETINLNYFHFWRFPSYGGKIGTYIGWIAIGSIILYAYFFHSFRFPRASEYF